jgi:hypothetical protein
MKKNETKSANSKPVQVRTKEQMEDRAFNKMLLWLAAAAVVEVVMVLFNRFSAHARVSELNVTIALNKILPFLMVVGVVLFVIFAYRGSKATGVRLTDDGTLHYIVAVACLCIGVGGAIIRFYGTTGGTMMLAVVPGLAVLALVYYLYQREFFACAVASALGILGMWIYRSDFSTKAYIAYLVVSLVIVVAILAVVLGAKKNDGACPIKGKSVTLFQEGAVYATYYITAVIAAVVLLLPLALGAAVAYYAIWVLVAWLCVLAVYFTSKMM